MPTFGQVRRERESGSAGVRECDEPGGRGGGASCQAKVPFIKPLSRQMLAKAQPRSVRLLAKNTHRFPFPVDCLAQLLLGHGSQTKIPTDTAGELEMTGTFKL